jgi:hypothetical protein
MFKCSYAIQYLSTFKPRRGLGLLVNLKGKVQGSKFKVQVFKCSNVQNVKYQQMPVFVKPLRLAWCKQGFGVTRKLKGQGSKVKVQRSKVKVHRFKCSNVQNVKYQQMPVSVKPLRGLGLLVNSKFKVQDSKFNTKFKIFKCLNFLS